MNRDGTGPNEEGPRTGKQQGSCNTEDSKVSIVDAPYTHTSQEAFTVPVFRLVGQKNSFTINNNLNKEQINLPSQVLGTLIEQLTKYKEYLDKEEKENDKKENTADD